MATKINYTDKVNLKTSPVADINKVKAENMNEIKEVVNTNRDDFDTHEGDINNPHGVTKAQVGLGNVDNTSDANKPISTATQTALNGKQDTLVSGTNIKSVNSQSLLGSGNLDLRGDYKATSLYNAKNFIQNKPILFPAINFVDGNAAPPTAFTGDIYVLIDLGNGAVNAGWNGAAYNDWVINDGSVWQSQSPTNGAICYDKTGLEYKKYNGSAWIDMAAATGGQVAIYDSSGVPTFYSTMTAALAAYSAGNVIQLMTNITENTAMNLPSNCQINGNGYTITNNANDATTIFTKPNTSTGKFIIKNLRLVKTTGTGSALIINDTGTSEWDTSDFYTYSPDGYACYIGTGVTKFDGNGSTFFESLNFYGCQTNGQDTRGVKAKTGAFIGFRITSSGGNAFNCQGESTTLAGFSNEGVGTAFRCIGKSASGNGLGFSGGGIYVDCIGISASNIGMWLGTFIGGYGKSSVGVGAQSSTCKQVYLESTSSYAAAYCQLEQCNVTAAGNIPVFSDAASYQISLCHITCNWNNAGGHGIGGTSAGMYAALNFIKVTHASAYGISVASGYFNNNNVRGGAGEINPATTISNTDTEDNFGNAQMV